ncbi:MAG: hypothetical protein GY702_03985 [Desulfobulbaceae bacterium]|nr:hypothetical protein [Desulfobulbaceae bacterium]
MRRENSLFEACRILFGQDILLSQDFLAYLQEEGINNAFRKRAMEIHPDKALVSGVSIEKSQEEFVSLQVACEMLRKHIASRKIRTRTTQNRGIVETNARSCSHVLPDVKLPFGRFLYRIGIIEWQQLIKALAWQKSGRLKIGEIGVKLGYLDKDSVIIILRHSGKNGAFGLTAQKMGFLTTNEVRDLLLKQRYLQKKIGQFFVEKGLLSRMELQTLLGQCQEHNRRIENLSHR